MTHLVLVRHGRTSYNTERRFQGQLDIPLDDVGRLQTTSLARYLAGRSFARLLTSDLARARETALRLGEELHLAVEDEPRLRECGFGDWEGVALTEVRRRWTERYRQWVHDSLPPPGGESYPEVRARVSGLLSELLGAHPSDNLLLVSHSTTIKMLIGDCLGIAVPPSRKLRLAECSVSELEHLPMGGWYLTYLNRVPEPGAPP